MDFQEIKQLLQLIKETEISEFKIEKEGFKLSIRSKEYVAALQQAKQQGIMPIPINNAPITSPIIHTAANIPIAEVTTTDDPTTPTKEANKEADSSNKIVVKSPMIGTFYRSSAPDKPPYIKIGDQIEVGSVLCIVEAMKLFNEIESEVSGKIVKILIEDNKPVEYDQDLFWVEPNN